jgi:DNA-binding response OmpR family regulator
MRLLLVEDDTPLRERLRVVLRQAGFAVDTAGDGHEAEFLGREVPYDVVVLDLGLPGKGGLDVLRAWRDAGQRVPVLVLTARDAWYERVDGFKAGADDYLGKPFHVEELVVRLNALLRRTRAASAEAVAGFGLRLDDDRQVAIKQDGEVVPLTGTEYRLLRYFMLNAGKLLSKARLTEHVYELDADKDSNVIEVYINRLRQKLGRDVVQTRRGQGYVFGKGD